MLRTILSITGKPGLFKIVAQSMRQLIVEDINSGKRFAVGARDKIVSLGDIAMYTDSGDKPLGEILDLVYANTNGEPLDVKALTADDGLRTKFEEIIPDFDKDRVYNNDIKKLFTWYNLLLSAGYKEFAEKEKPAESEEESEAKEESK